MSTDMQKYSTENQRTLIALYAASQGFEIVRTYSDEGRSGLSIKGRVGLQQLLQDVRDGNADFGTVLVYDVSRWGRFQDADESAHYEFLCREAGIAVRYCAEEFANDGSVTATIIKSIKRAMAAEYSRELSSRMSLAKTNMARRGFSHGRAVFGLRRMLLDEHGHPKGILENGQRKCLFSDRTTFVPGPQKEVQTVRWVFAEFATTDVSISALAAKLNAEGILNNAGRPWRIKGVRAMLSNEKYIGNNVFGKTSYRLRLRRIKRHPGQWVRAEEVFKPIVDKEVFQLAQNKLRRLKPRVTSFELLSTLTAIWCRHGRLSSTILRDTAGCPATNSFKEHFGSMLEAFEAVGYRRASHGIGYVSTRRRVVQMVTKELKRLGHSVQEVGNRRQAKLLINNELTIFIANAHCFYRTLGGEPRWVLKRSIVHQSDLLMIVRPAETTIDSGAYFFVPDLTSNVAQQLLFDRNHLEIESFKCKTLEPMQSLFAREVLVEARPLRVLEPSLPRLESLRAPKFSSSWLNRKKPHAKMLLRAFQRYSGSMRAFAEKAHEITSRQRSLEESLQSLLRDSNFAKMLKRKGLDSIPTLTARRLYG